MTFIAIDVEFVRHTFTYHLLNDGRGFHLLSRNAWWVLLKQLSGNESSILQVFAALRDGNQFFATIIVRARHVAVVELWHWRGHGVVTIEAQIEKLDGVYGIDSAPIS